MRISRARWASLLLLASFVTGLLSPAGVSAQTERVTVTSSYATAVFPDSITFELEANVEGNVAQVDLLYQMAALETLQLLPGEFEQDGANLGATAFLDLEIAFLPVGIDLTFHWIISFDDGETVETETATITWLDDRFEWDRLASEHVEVFGYDTSDDFLQLILDTAEQSAQEQIALYQPETVFLPVRIWVYETGEDYAGTQAANSQEWSAGSAYPDLQVIHAVIPDGSESEVSRIIPHEISHQILHMATRNPYNSPATWIDEGLAVVAQEGSEDLYESVLEDAFEDDELLSMQGLISAFPFDPADARLAYAQSYSMIVFIIETWGQEGITAMIQAYAAGNSHDDVLIAALGVDLTELEQQWLSWLGDEFGMVAA